MNERPCHAASLSAQESAGRGSLWIAVRICAALDGSRGCGGWPGGRRSGGGAGAHATARDPGRGGGRIASAGCHGHDRAGAAGRGRRVVVAGRVRRGLRRLDAGCRPAAAPGRSPSVSDRCGLRRQGEGRAWRQGDRGDQSRRPRVGQPARRGRAGGPADHRVPGRRHDRGRAPDPDPRSVRHDRRPDRARRRDPVAEPAGQ